MATAAAVVLGVGVLAVAGRLLPGIPSARPPATGGVATVAATTVGTRRVLVPRAVGRTLAQARAVMGRAGLPSGAVDRDPRAPGAVVVTQEPPAGVRVPPHSPVGFRTRTDVWPNGRPRRLRLGAGPATASYRVVAASPMFDPLSVVLTMPAAADLEVWTRTRLRRRVLLETTHAAGGCRPTRRQARCAVTFEPAGDEDPGIWTVGVAKRSPRPATVRITVTFSRT